MGVTAAGPTVEEVVVIERQPVITDGMKPTLLRYLELVAEYHTRTSCSDSNPCNDYTTHGRGGTPRCERCLILAAIAGRIPLSDVHIEKHVEYRITRPSED